MKKNINAKSVTTATRLFAKNARPKTINVMLVRSTSGNYHIKGAEYLDEVQEDMKVEKNYIFKKEVNQMLEAVDAALKKIDDGTYGIDKKTGEPIDPARLELFPESDENVK